ncbi:hypothetical protein ACLB90_07870 [Stenotrophomonas sp. LGBM10]|uniref:hypothetical protein n=1 Tax=Stenotrophomonas sp. LGBM10 TaxID=3390038 RepID=UPI00398B24A3
MVGKEQASHVKPDRNFEGCLVREWVVQSAGIPLGLVKKINMVQILPDAPFDPTCSGGFSPDQGGNFVSYSLDVAGFLANLG